MKNDNDRPTGEFILYQTEDGRTRIECRFENETLWLAQAQMAELFQTTPQNITLHLKAIYAEGEQAENATCKSYLQVRQEGERTINWLGLVALSQRAHYGFDRGARLDGS
jgi:hypothetical protein